MAARGFRLIQHSGRFAAECIPSLRSAAGPPSAWDGPWTPGPGSGLCGSVISEPLTPLGKLAPVGGVRGAGSLLFAIMAPEHRGR